jgi:type III pantothenate kinase
MSTIQIVAADIGNARIKLGLFVEGCAAGLPEPVQTLPLVGKEPELDWIEAWLNAGRNASRACEHAPYEWWIASVNRPAATRLIDWLREHRPRDRVVLLAAGDVPLVVRLERPDMVGIDRLVDAVAVNRLREAGRSAVIVDVGSAITVDLVSAEGAFLGGAILPGIQMAARALHHFTDLLPLVDVAELTAPPPALGDATVPAMKAGLFWGAVGAIRQLIEQLGKAASDAEPQGGWDGSSTAAPAQVFLTGGAGAAVAELLGQETRYVPNLTLSGIAQIAWECRSTVQRRLM